MHKCRVKTMKKDWLSNHSQYKNFLLENSEKIQLVTSKFKYLQSAIIKHSNKEESISMKKNYFGLYLIEVLLQGKRFNFIIDTGAQISALKKEHVLNLKMELKEQNIEVGSISGVHKNMQLFHCPYLIFANQIVSNLTMLALEDLKLEIPLLKKDLLKIDGIIGWDILSQFDFEIDTIHKEFKIIKNVYTFTYQNMIAAPFPTIIVEDNKNNLLLFGIDTGAKVSWLSKEYMETYYMEDQIKDLTVLGFGVHGKEEMQLKSLDQFDCKLNRGFIHLKQVMSGRVDLLNDVKYAGVLGSEIFKNRKIRFINSKSMILFA